MRELGISLSAYGVLSRGFLGGTWTKERYVDENDFRKHVPRFLGDNLDRNLSLVEALRPIAGKETEDDGVRTIVKEERFNIFLVQRCHGRFFFV